MKFFQIDLGDEFRALPESQRKQLCSEWQARQKSSAFAQHHGQIAVFLYYLAFPFGLFLLWTSQQYPSRLTLGLSCVVIPVLWFLLPIAVRYGPWHTSPVLEDYSEQS